MSLDQKVAAVEQVFANLDHAISEFQSWSTLHCNHGCGKCCFKPDIEATTLEFLPLALQLYKEGSAEKWRDELLKEESTICKVLNPTQGGAGLCSRYAHRGLICRLFGYSARTNKYSKKELVTCRIIKTEQADQFVKAENEIEADRPVPVMTDYYHQLQSVDPELTRDFYPINEAIRRAIEEVMQYYAYRE